MLLSNLNPCFPMPSTTDHNYGITALHNYDFTVKLSPKKLENQNFLPVKIEIFKIKTPLPIQLPS
jgi:hypothetical protein